MSDTPRELAAGLRAIIDRLRTIDVEHASGGVRAAEDAVAHHAQQLEALGSDAGTDTMRQALEIHREACQALAQALEDCGRALEAAQSDRAMSRMRLAELVRSMERDVAQAAELSSRGEAMKADIEGLRADLRKQGETLATLRAESAMREESLRREIEAREQQLAGQRETIARLEATLGEAGHRLVTRVGELAARHPLVAAALRAPVRWVSRLLGGRRG